MTEEKKKIYKLGVDILTKDILKASERIGKFKEEHPELLEDPDYKDLFDSLIQVNAIGIDFHHCLRTDTERKKET